MSLSLLKSCVALVAAASLIGLAAAVSVPKFPNSFLLTGTFSLPYAHLVEPVTLRYDGVNGRIRLEWYNGLDYFIYRNDVSQPTTYEVYTRINKPACAVAQNPAGQNISLTTMLPDLTLSGWTFVAVEFLNQQQVQHWRLTDPEGSKTNVYDFYVNVQGGFAVPVRFAMMGYNVIGMSHFDQYVVDYTSFEPRLFGNSDFAAPAVCTSEAAETIGERSRSSLHYMEAMFPPNSHSSAFSKYKNIHGRNYSADGEHDKRHTLFIDNLLFIHDHNSNHKAFRMHVNDFADMHIDELKGSFVSSKPMSLAANAPESYVPSVSDPLPASVDWTSKGAETPVKDQAFCGSCWSFSATETLESAYFMKYGQLPVLTPQQYVDCAWNPFNNGCDGGNSFAAYDYMLQNNVGLNLDQDYPYLGQDGYCNSDATKFNVKIASYANVTVGDELALTSAIANVGPVSVAIMVTRSFIFYGSGVYYEPTCKSDAADLDHAVVASGYGTDSSGGDYYIVRNSWSSYWANNGYIWMARNHNNNCGIATDAVVVYAA
eukprot:ANDGO_04191.mRNA.1 Counting factor associated protein D